MSSDTFGIFLFFLISFLALLFFFVYNTFTRHFVSLCQLLGQLSEKNKSSSSVEDCDDTYCPCADEYDYEYEDESSSYGDNGEQHEEDDGDSLPDFLFTPPGSALD